MTCRRHITFLCVLVLLAYPSHLLPDEPFAPWAKLTPEGASASQQQKIPTKAEVGIPAYPNAYIISLAAMEDKKIGKTLNIIHMVSPDSPEVILSFYKEKLMAIEGWKWDEIFEAFHTGEDYTKAMSQLNPFVEIVAVSLNTEDLKYVDPSLKETLKSRIQIAYNPK
ncbi:MAG: hypothetical protein JSV88_15630 [Candidatus Aminicenantes bacterium]|nr:MAG: hypothetical protein JSV88_15630 [Candidatus Aminicenantes bacterium]